MIEFQNRQVKLLDGSPVNICLIKGSIDGSTLFEFEEKLLGFLDHGVRHLIIVFSQVHYINSTGMGVLVKLADKFQEVGGDFNLVDVPDKMVALFNMLGLLSLIK
jgi:anti-sigma B factor antagonist